MSVIVTTSDAYIDHILPIFIHLAEEYGLSKDGVIVIGYKSPSFDLPENYKFHSLGEQKGDAKNFGTDLSKCFADNCGDQILWIMEDMFIREPVNWDQMLYAHQLMNNDASIGRISLTTNSINQYTEVYPFGNVANGRVLQTPEKSEYRLSTYPAIWRKEFLLRYLQPNMNPWEFECQEKVSDEFLNVALEKPALIVNEGVRRRNIHDYNLEGIDPSVIQAMRDKNII